MNTEIAKEAFNTVCQYKEHATKEQFNKIEESIKGHDINLSGVGFYAIQAKMKLQKISELDLPNFIETLKFI